MADTPQPSADAVAVFGLLSIIADPAAAKARMVELEQIRASAAEAQEKHRVTLLELRQTAEKNAGAASNNDRLLAERTASINDKQAVLSVATAELAAKEQDLTARRAQFAQQSAEVVKAHTERDAALAKREQDVTDHNNDLKGREDNLKARELSVSHLIDEANAIKADYERKSAALQKALR